MPVLIHLGKEKEHARSFSNRNTVTASSLLDLETYVCGGKHIFHNLEAVI
jgi:hypothetical protein